MEIITLNGQEYGYVVNYRNEEKMRDSFNKLTRKVYGFDFEEWYCNGYWGENYIPYSLLEGDTIVSNVSVSVIKFLLNGNEKTFIQIGTVMTEPSKRNQGLNAALLVKVLQEWRGNCDLIYLFANDSVLDFYPKYGFQRVEQYQCSKKLEFVNTQSDLVKLDMSVKENKEFLLDKVNRSCPFSQLSMMDNASLVLFYCTSFLTENVFYIKELDAIAIADLDEHTLFLKDVFCEKKVELSDVISALSNRNTFKVVLEFTPQCKNSFDENILIPDDVLFVLDDTWAVFENDRLMFPVLSHA